MQPLTDWRALRDQVEQRFLQLSTNNSLVVQALESLDDWLSQPIYATQREAILGHVVHEQFPLLLDSFYQFVPFGTGGRRGRVGYGPNRINQITVAMSVQGHCKFLRDNYPSSASRKIVIAFDTRVFSDIAKSYEFLDPASLLLGLTSRALARIACEIYAGNGFEVYVAGLHSETEYLSTPELSFAIRHLEALAGMNVSASHNHPDDNGFKFFNEQGAQDIPPTDQTMASYMGNVTEIQRTSFDEAVADGRIRALPAELHAAYIGTNLALRSKQGLALTVVYTPLCGTGDRSAGDVLRAAGYDVRVYGPHNTYDGTFAEIPFRLPNPEVPEAASPALGFANEVGADVVLCTDPDADRLGVFARDSRGRWRYLNGNEIASILAYYLCLDANIGPKRSGVIIKTLVTTRMLQRIAELSGCSIVPDLLVGFKYIAHVLHCLEREGCYEGIHASAGDLVFAGEESHGVLLTPAIRDKDAAGGALILCELLSQLRAQGEYLPEYLDTLALQCGNYQNVARSVVMRGIPGSELLARMMRSLREDPPSVFDGMPVLQTEDFLLAEHGPLRSETERSSRNLLLYRLEKAQIVIRPSGTEPKVKIYVDAEGAKLVDARDRKQAANFARRLAADVVEQCIGRIGVHLPACANLLPDYVDLDLKGLFATGFRNDLLAAADRLSRQSPAEQLAWLRERLAPYSAGADPLEATAPAVARLLGDMADEVHNPAIKATFHALKQAVEEAPAPIEWVT